MADLNVSDNKSNQVGVCIEVYETTFDRIGRYAGALARTFNTADIVAVVPTVYSDLFVGDLLTDDNYYPGEGELQLHGGKRILILESPREVKALVEKRFDEATAPDTQNHLRSLLQTAFNNTAPPERVNPSMQYRVRESLMTWKRIRDKFTKNILRAK